MGSEVPAPRPPVLTCGCALHIGVEEGNDDVNKHRQVEGDAAPQSHAAREPVDQWHAYKGRVVVGWRKEAP